MSEKIRALVIDDKRIIADMFKFFLEFQGHTVVFIDDPDDALKKIKEDSFDIAFCDIVMPQKNGITLLKEIKSAIPELPVVMMSGFTVEEDRARARELGALACLNKPFEREDVLKVIKTATGKDV